MLVQSFEEMVRQSRKDRGQDPGLAELTRGYPKEGKTSACQSSGNHSAIEEGMEAGSETEEIPTPCVQISSPEDPPEPIRFDQEDLHEVSEEDDERDNVKVWQRNIRQAQKKASGKIMKQERGFYGRAAAGLVSWDASAILK